MSRLFREVLRKLVAAPLCALDRDVFVWPGVGEIFYQVEPGLADSGADTIDERQLPDRRDHRFLVHQLLHLLEDRSPSLMVELCGLLGRQCVDIGVAAINVGPGFDDEGVKASGSIAERAGAALDEVLVRLVGSALQKRGALNRTQASSLSD